MKEILWTFLGYMTITFIMLSSARVLFGTQSEVIKTHKGLRGILCKLHGLFGIIALLSSISFCVLDLMIYGYLTLVAILDIIILLLTVVTAVLYLLSPNRKVLRRIHTILGVSTAVLLFVHELEPIWT